MNRISPIWEKCVNYSSIKFWLLKATFVIAAAWVLSLAYPMDARAQQPVNTNSGCNSSTTTTSDPTEGITQAPIGPSSMNYGAFGFYDGLFATSFGVINNALGSLLVQMTGTNTTTVPATNPNQTQTVAANNPNQTQSGPCIVKR